MRLGLFLDLVGQGAGLFEPSATLALDFTTGRYRVGAGGYSYPDFASLPNLTVTRATPSVAYAENADGTLTGFGPNVARIGVGKGLLVEEARTNLLLWSQDFTNAAWSKSGLTATAAAIAAPDGTLTGTKLAESNTTVNVHYALQSITFTAAAYTYSVYVKAAERTWAYIQQDTVPSGSYFNLSGSGSLGSTTGTAPTARSITALANGWFRISITFTASVSGAAVYVMPATGDNANSYAGTVGSGIYVWNTDLNAAAFQLSPVVTTSASVTRAADVVSLASQTAPASGYTMFAEVMVPAVSTAYRNFFGLNDGTSNNTTDLGNLSASSYHSMMAGGVSQADFNGAFAMATGSTHKTAFAVAAGRQMPSVDGAITTAQTGASLNSGTRTAMLGRDVFNRFANGYLRKVLLYPTAYADAALQALTT